MPSQFIIVTNILYFQTICNLLKYVINIISICSNIVNIIQMGCSCLIHNVVIVEILL